jgi:serine/threonine protein kinase
MYDALMTEIGVMKELKSENIVHLYDVVKTPPTTFMVLELCADGDLEGLLKKAPNHQLPED